MGKECVRVLYFVLGFFFFFFVEHPYGWKNTWVHTSRKKVSTNYDTDPVKKAIPRNRYPSNEIVPIVVVQIWLAAHIPNNALQPLAWAPYSYQTNTKTINTPKS